MGILIDTSILIDFERGRLDLASHIRGREHEDFFLPVITASELLGSGERLMRGYALDVRLLSKGC